MSPFSVVELQESISMLRGFNIFGIFFFEQHVLFTKCSYD